MLLGQRVDRGDLCGWTHAMALFDPGQPLLSFDIIRVEVQYIFEACAHVFRFFEQAREPEPGLLVAVVGLNRLREQRAGLVAPAGEGSADALFEECSSHGAFPAMCVT